MDRRTREIERRWRETGDINLHITLLHMLMRNGTLPERRILCAGFFGHKASRLALPEKIKRTKVIDGDTTLPTEELNDWIKSIFRWPRDVRIKVVWAMVFLAKSHIRNDDYKKKIEAILPSIKKCLDSPGADTRKELRQCLRQRGMTYWPHELGPWGSRQQIIGRALQEMLYTINSRVAVADAMLSMGAQFKDRIFRKAISDEVLPYLLGEWK